MTGWWRPLGFAVALAALGGAAIAKPLMVGFYLPWDAASEASLLAHADSLDILAPMSGALVSAQGGLRWQDDPARAAVLAKTSPRPKVFPVVSNAHDNVWDAAAADGVLLDDRAGAAFIAGLVDQAKAQAYGGYVLDLESLSQRAAPAYAPFLARLRAALRPLGRQVWVTTSLAADPALVRQLSAAADVVVLMAYDQCWATSTPGPIAGQDWLETHLDAVVGSTNPSGYVLALGGYGYDWPQGKPGEVVSAAEAAGRAKAKGQAVMRALPDVNPHFAYRNPDGEAHAVWYLDGAAFRTQRAAAEARHVRGLAIWRLGLEDPAIWTKALPPKAMGVSGPSPPCVALPPHP